MQAIQTRFLGATNTKLSRVKAYCAGGFCYHAWDHSKDQEQNHVEAVRKLRGKLGWFGKSYSEMVGGTLPNGDMAWVFVLESTTDRA